MRLRTIFLIAVVNLCIIHVTWAEGNPVAGKAKAQACAACHGPKGDGINPQWPKLAGQNEKYFIEQMLDFKQGKKSGRENAVMQGIVAPLSQQDIADLAAYFAAQKPNIGAANPKLVQQGQALYRGGNLKQGIPACSACHGPRGRGNAEAGFPALGGQYAKYTVQQLEAYKKGSRKNDINGMMATIASKLSTQEIRAVADYIQGLH